MNKAASTMLKALGILLMLTTHFLDRQQPDNLLSIPLPNGSNVASYIGKAAAICVVIFAFVNGYGLTKKYDSFSSLGRCYLYSLKKAAIFLLEYWLIFFSLFFPFYAVSVEGNIDWALVLRSLVGYSGIVAFAWYVWFFLGLLIILPLLRFCFPKTMKWGVALLLAYIPLMTAVIVWTSLDRNDAFDSWRGTLSYFISCVVGCALSRTNGIEGIRTLLNKAKLDRVWFYGLVSLAGLAIYAALHKAIIAPFAVLPIVFFFARLSEKTIPKGIGFVVDWLAALSMPIWFIHYAFFADYVNRYVPLFDIASLPRIGVLVVLFVLAMCIPVALIYRLAYMAALFCLGELKKGVFRSPM